MAQVLGRSASTIADDAAVFARAGNVTRPHRAGQRTLSPHPGGRGGTGDLGSGSRGLVPLSGWARSTHRPRCGLPPGLDHHRAGNGSGRVLVLAASVLVGRGSPTGRRPRQGSSKSGAWRRSAPVAIGLGTTMAFETGRGPRRVPVLPALLAATVAVMGVVASLTIDRGINYALHHPELAGVTWDASVTPALGAQTGRNISPKLARQVTEAPGIRAAAVVDRDVINVGNVGAPVFSVRPVAGASATSITFALTSGRAPRWAGRSGYRPRDRQGPSRRHR